METDWVFGCANYDGAVRTDPTYKEWKRATLRFLLGRLLGCTDPTYKEWKLNFSNW